MKCSWSNAIQIFDKSMHSWDIRDQIESCQKSRRILDIFAFPNFVGGTTCKISVHLITQALNHLPW